MSIYKKQIEKRISEISKLISQLQVLDERKGYIEELVGKKRELEKIIEACEGVKPSKHCLDCSHYKKHIEFCNACAHKNKN